MEYIPNGRTLEILNISPNDEGVYQCFGRNGYGIARDEVMVRINKYNVIKTELKVKVKPEKNTYRAGDNFNLTCEVEQVKNLEFSYNWLFKGKRLSEYPHNNMIQQENVLVVRNAKIEQSGLYACEAKYIYEDHIYEGVATIEIVDNAEEEALEVELLAHYTSFFVGESAYLKCNVLNLNEIDPSYNKDIQFVWKRTNGKPIEYDIKDDENGKSQTISIFNLKEDDSGIYTCQAMSPIHNIVSNKAYITIFVSPKKSAKPSISYQEPPKVRIENYINEKQYFVANQTAYFYCVASGNPQPFITWKRVDNKPLNNRTKLHFHTKYALLQINNLHKEDSGVYECIGKSPIGEAKTKITVVVKEESKKVIHYYGKGIWPKKKIIFYF